MKLFTALHVTMECVFLITHSTKQHSLLHKLWSWRVALRRLILWREPCGDWSGASLASGLAARCLYFSQNVFIWVFVLSNNCQNVIVICEQRPTCSWLAFVKLVKLQLNVKVLLFVYASRDNAVLTCGCCMHWDGCTCFLCPVDSVFLAHICEAD